MAQSGSWATSDIYVSGPAAMVDATVATLVRQGVPEDRIRYDTPWQCPPSPQPSLT